MSNAFLKTAIRTWFAATSRAAATARIRGARARYLELADLVDAASGARAVRVPLMRGVDEDMRDWSFFMIAEHNAIVNRSIAANVSSLARGEAPTGAGAIDPKRDVMPSAQPGPEQFEAFMISVEDYLAMLPELGRLRGTMTTRHPLFGDFDAHRWHCMLGFHLHLHLKQATFVVDSCAG